MKSFFRVGVRVYDGEETAEFPARDFKVLENGALELGGPLRMTIAPGAWKTVQFILAEDDPAAAEAPELGGPRR